MEFLGISSSTCLPPCFPLTGLISSINFAPIPKMVALSLYLHPLALSWILGSYSQLLPGHLSLHIEFRKSVTGSYSPSHRYLFLSWSPPWWMTFTQASSLEISKSDSPLFQHAFANVCRFYLVVSLTLFLSFLSPSFIPPSPFQIVLPSFHVSPPEFF